MYATAYNNGDNYIPTVSQALYEYIELRKPKKSTAKAYRSILYRCCPDWMELPVTDITTEMVVKRHKQLSETAPTQANYCFRILKALFTFSADYWESPDGVPLMARNPVKRLTTIKAWNREHSRIDEMIEEKDISAWFHGVLAVNNETMRDFLIFLLLTSLRLSEAARLKWEDVDLEAGYVFVGEDVEVNGKIQKQTKNGKAHRLPLSDYLLEMLRLRQVRNPLGCDYVFPSRYGNGPISSPYKAVEYVKERTGVDFKIHSLRRTFASIATHPEIKGDELGIKGILNHSTGDVTWRHYMQAHPERLRPIVQGVTDFVLKKAGVKWTKPKSAPMTTEPSALLS